MSYSDTSPAARRLVIDGYRRMSPLCRLAQAGQLTQAVQQMALSRVRKRYGRCSEREERLRLASLWIPRRTMIASFGWDPQQQGR